MPRLPLDFDFVVPDADIVKTQIAQHILRLFDHAQLFGRDRLAVRDSRTQAGHLRLVRGGKAKVGRQGANVGLRQAGFLEGRADLKFARGLAAGPIVAEVARVLSVSDDRELFLPRQRDQVAEQFMFAKITAVVRIGEVGRVVELFGAHDAQRDGKLAGHGHRFLQFATRQTGRIGQDRERFLTKDLVGHKCQKNGIHPAGIGHQARTVRG